MDRSQIACLFSSAPIAGCGGSPPTGAVFAAHWPLALIGGALFGWAVWIFVGLIYRRDIDWCESDADAPKYRPDRALRDAGE